MLPLNCQRCIIPRRIWLARTFSATSGDGKGEPGVFAKGSDQKQQFSGQRSPTNCVEKAHLFEYWEKSNEQTLEVEFDRGKIVLMVDRLPLIEAESFESTDKSRRPRLKSSPRLRIFDCKELREKLRKYGLEIGILNSALLDVFDPNPSEDYKAIFGSALRLMPPPEESKISIERLREDLGVALGGNFLDLRYSVLTMDDTYHRNLLAKFQAITRWYKVFIACPRCTSLLRMRPSKSAAECPSCDLDFYPTISPVAICLIHDSTNENCLLVRHHGSANSVFTCIAGFCAAGETLEQTVRREVAEEVGIECWDVRPLNSSQPWPLPASSLMLPFVATADKNSQVSASVVELEYARWFSRAQVEEALRRVEIDPFLHKVQRHVETSGKDPEVRKDLRYIPPKGAIAHHIIKDWINRKI